MFFEERFPVVIKTMTLYATI